MIAPLQAFAQDCACSRFRLLLLALALAPVPVALPADCALAALAWNFLPRLAQCHKPTRTTVTTRPALSHCQSALLTRTFCRCYYLKAALNAPTCTRPRRLARPRTSPFHGGNTGSNPVGDAN